MGWFGDKIAALKEALSYARIDDQEAAGLLWDAASDGRPAVPERDILTLSAQDVAGATQLGLSEGETALYVAAGNNSQEVVRVEEFSTSGPAIPEPVHGYTPQLGDDLGIVFQQQQERSIALGAPITVEFPDQGYTTTIDRDSNFDVFLGELRAHEAERAAEVGATIADLRQSANEKLVVAFPDAHAETLAVNPDGTARVFAVTPSGSDVATIYASSNGDDLPQMGVLSGAAIQYASTHPDVLVNLEHEGVTVPISINDSYHTVNARHAEAVTAAQEEVVTLKPQESQNAIEAGRTALAESREGAGFSKRFLEDAVAAARPAAAGARHGSDDGASPAKAGGAKPRAPGGIS